MSIDARAIPDKQWRNRKAAAVIKHLALAEHHQLHRRMTARERQVATLIAQGLTNRQIAQQLAIGERTVDTHVGKIFLKLGFLSRGQVTVWATEQGLS